MISSHPILSCEQARIFEESLFGGQEERQWQAMERAGRSVARALLKDYAEQEPFPQTGRILVLAGKGNNGGDALLAALELLEQRPRLMVDVLPVFGEAAMRPLAQRALRLLQEASPERVHRLQPARLDKALSYLVSLDGIFGFQFRAPMDPAVAAIIAWEAALEVGMRVSVDLPSGCDSLGAYRADFTYATGIVKSPLLFCSNAGRLRYLDLGFFEEGQAAGEVKDWVLRDEVLKPLRGFRQAKADKRSFGHVFVVGGSRQYPGAILMSVLGALRSGAGLVTAFVPESLVPSFAARAPEAMWVGWPETPEGGLALEGYYQLQHRLNRASALVLGPGLGREPETLLLAERIVEGSTVPLVIDADALQARIAKVGAVPRILTPHAGEYLRMASGVDPRVFSRSSGAVLVLKGPVTQIVSGDMVHHSFVGGPVLARGGSGDLLAGLMGGLLAQAPSEPLQAAARAVVWQGLAADQLARNRGAAAVVTTDLLDWLPRALRGGSDE